MNKSADNNDSHSIVRERIERFENKFRSPYTDYTFNRTASWSNRDGKQITPSIKYNDALEVEGMTEINKIEPPSSNVTQNRRERQAFADVNNNGKIGRAFRYYSDCNHKEAWVDVDAKVFWEVWVA